MVKDFSGAERYGGESQMMPCAIRALLGGGGAYGIREKGMITRQISRSKFRWPVVILYWDYVMVMTIGRYALSFGEVSLEKNFVIY